MDKNLIKKIIIASVMSFTVQTAFSAQTVMEIPPAPLKTSALIPPLPLVQNTPTKQVLVEEKVKQVTVTRSAPQQVVVVDAGNTRRTPVVIPAPLTYEQSQQVMLNSVPDRPTANEDGNAAFNMLMQKNMPLTPQQVVKLRQLIDRSQRAAITPANIPPRPVSTTIMMNLAPGTTPPAIRLAEGYVSSLVFVDSTGAPWPIAGYDIGDPKTTNIQWDGKSNVLLLQAISPYGNSDLVIRLVGMMTPLTLEIVLGQRVVDYRTDIHVSGIGPNTKDIPMGSPLPAGASQLLLGVLDGVAPPESHPLTVRGAECQAWSIGDRMFLRTRLTILSPGWVGKMASPDGMYAYEIPKSSSVLVSKYGEPVELKIEGL